MKNIKFNFSFGDGPNKHEYYKWDFARDDGRELIREWSRKRIKRMEGLQKSYYGFLVYTFNWNTIKHFCMNFNIVVILQMMIAGSAVYFFEHYDIGFDFNVSLFVSPIVFPLAFSINTDFQRREKVLDDLANFKSATMIWYFCIREWNQAAELDEDFLNAVHLKIKSIMFNLREYLLTYQLKRRRTILRYMYEDFSDANQLIEKVRASKLPANSALMSRLIHCLNNMCLSFERLRVVREYRSPRSIRSFNKVLILFLPIILCPYFVYLGKKQGTTVWCPYVLAVLVSAVFSALQGVQDKLDDPFDGMSSDDINLDTIDEWTFNSLESTVSRKCKIGRFQVATDKKESMMSKLKCAMESLNLTDESDSSTTFVRKPSFVRHKRAKSVFNRTASTAPSAFKRGSTRQSTIRHVFQQQKEPAVTSNYTFCPESHPYANVLKNLSGKERITRSGSVFATTGSNVNLLSSTFNPIESVNDPDSSQEVNPAYIHMQSAIVCEEAASQPIHNTKMDAYTLPIGSSENKSEELSDIRTDIENFTANIPLLEVTKDKPHSDLKKSPLGSITEEETRQVYFADDNIDVECCEESGQFNKKESVVTQPLLRKATEHRGRFSLKSV